VSHRSGGTAAAPEAPPHRCRWSTTPQRGPECPLFKLTPLINELIKQLINP